MRLLDCNDAALRLWQDGEGIWSPGIAWFAGGQYQFGEPAWQRARLSPREINNRFWHRLSTQPLSPALGPAPGVLFICMFETVGLKILN